MWYVWQHPFTESWQHPFMEAAQLDTELGQTSSIKTFNLSVVHLEWMYGWMFSISQTDTERVCI